MDHPQLEPLLTGLHATPSVPLPFMDGVDLHSFVLETEQGLVVIYNTPAIDTVGEEISSLGKPRRLLINHWHEGMSGTPSMNIPTFVHSRDQAQLESTMRVDGTFEDQQMIGDDLEVIPSLAHTPGAAFYLWNNGEHKILFVGDSFWVENGVWKAVLLGESNRKKFLETLEHMRDLDFDVLAPWPAQRGRPAIDVITEKQKQKQIDGLTARIKAGASGPSS
ncbi:MBL fold metallo-hydrolase [Arthrobacter sp. UYCu721]|uniref:MBL fold metallo-hydrolase n=1 Tax=Pseudarthrobacter sp. Y6 TaxID=3418422 RepID=UPI003396B96D